MVGCLSGLNEMGIGNEVLDGFMVVFAHGRFPLIDSLLRLY